MKPFCVFVTILALALPAAAWNATGHRIISAIAYDRLTPVARAKVDELIKHHPDYATLFTAGGANARGAFLYASTWPDVIRGDMRFYDETRPDFAQTPLLPGFASMSRHVTWHYYDIPFAPDGAKTHVQQPPHALSELRRMLANIADEPAAEAAYDLPWLEHILGDVHQPLHATTRFLRAQPKGDAGGNFVFVMSNTLPTNPGQAIPLHAYWDNLAGTDTSDAAVNQFAAGVMAEYPAPSDFNLNPNRWLKESFKLDRSDVYSFGLATGTKDQPLHLSPEYDARAKTIARQRIALAGYRLAAVLNERFK
jgi:hypothetical protein